jgi:intracellular sulfur oxidation DsrE/DsrF family protein
MNATRQQPSLSPAHLRPLGACIAPILALVFAVVVPLAIAPARAADSESAPIPSITSGDPYVAVPGATKLASKKRVYRVVFDARHGADKPDELVPAINMASSEINTLAAHGVPRKNVKFVIVFHTAPANDGLLDNAHYRAKFGIDNPNLNVLAELKAAGVGLYVCGQELLADKVPMNAVSHDVTVVEDGLVTSIEFQNDGYAHLSF